MPVISQATTPSIIQAAGSRFEEDFFMDVLQNNHVEFENAGTSLVVELGGTLNLPRMWNSSAEYAHGLSFPGLMSRYCHACLIHERGFDNVLRTDPFMNECIVTPAVVFTFRPAGGSSEESFECALLLAPVVVTAYRRLSRLLKFLGPGAILHGDSTDSTSQSGSLSQEVAGEVLSILGFGALDSQKLRDECLTWRGVMIALCFEFDDFADFMSRNRINPAKVLSLVEVLEGLKWHLQFFDECNPAFMMEQVWSLRKCEIISYSIAVCHYNPYPPPVMMSVESMDFGSNS